MPFDIVPAFSATAHRSPPALEFVDHKFDDHDTFDSLSLTVFCQPADASMSSSKMVLLPPRTACLFNTEVPAKVDHGGVADRLVSKAARIYRAHIKLIYVRFRASLHAASDIIFLSRATLHPASVRMPYPFSTINR